MWTLPSAPPCVWESFTPTPLGWEGEFDEMNLDPWFLRRRDAFVFHRGGVMLVHDIRKNETKVIDFRETAPSGVSELMLTQTDLDQNVSPCPGRLDCRLTVG